MTRQIPLVYYIWDEEKQEATEEIGKVVVSRGVLFLRKLVNATMIRNRLYEHSSHETDENGQGSIYVTNWNPHSVDNGITIEQALYQKYDVSEEGYAVELYVLDGQEASLLSSTVFHEAMDIAEILLDHFRPIGEVTYELVYAILDHDRHKVLIFLKPTEYQ